MWNMTFLFAGLIFTLFILMVFCIKGKLPTKENYVFKKILIVTLMAYFIEIPLQLIVRINGIDSILVDIVARIYIISITLWYSIFTLYVFVIGLSKKDEKKYNKKIRICKNVLIFGFIIMAIVLYILPMNKYYGSGKMDTYGNEMDS